MAKKMGSVTAAPSKHAEFATADELLGFKAKTKLDTFGSSKLESDTDVRNFQLLKVREHRAAERMGFLPKLKYRIKTAKLQSDFLMGNYFLDWWETAVVYSLYALLSLLVIYGAFKQLQAGFAMVKGLAP